MSRTQIHLDEVYLSQEERDAAAWQAQWKKAIEGTSGIAPYLEEGAEYVESVRRVDTPLATCN